LSERTNAWKRLQEAEEFFQRDEAILVSFWEKLF
jgi:hypothetical protein